MSFSILSFHAPSQLVRPGNRLKSRMSLPFLFSCPENCLFSRMEMFLLRKITINLLISKTSKHQNIKTYDKLLVVPKCLVVNDIAICCPRKCKDKCTAILWLSIVYLPPIAQAWQYSKTFGLLICLNHIKFLSSQGFTRECACRTRMNIKTGSPMCKRVTSGTYLKVNALPVDAPSCFFPLTIIVDHFLY